MFCINKCPQPKVTICGCGFCPQINTLVLHSPRNESFLEKFPADILEEPMQFKSISMAHASLGELASYAISGSHFLRELTLSACGISGLLKNAISGLEVMFLFHNQPQIDSSLL